MFVCVCVFLEIKGGTKFSYNECLKSYGNILAPPTPAPTNAQKKEIISGGKKRKMDCEERIKEYKNRKYRIQLSPYSFVALYLPLSFILSLPLSISLHFYHTQKTSAVR